ncbi:MAG: hypothetical protein EOO18_01055, partial [Chryseobacterium sp.]
MNWIDIILFLIVLVSIISSADRGFILSALDLVCWAGSLALGLLLYRPLSQFFDRYISPLDASYGFLDFELRAINTDQRTQLVVLLA